MFPIAYAADAAAEATAQTGGQWGSWLMIIAVFALMYFLLIRPQNKKEKEAKQMRDSLKPGDEVITIGGICGTVARVKDESDRVVIMVGSDRVKIEILRNAIAERHGKDDPVKAEKKKDEEPAKPNKKNIKKLGAKEDAPQAEAPAEEK